MAKLAKKIYGKALLDLALEEKLVDVFFEEAVELQKILKNEPDLKLLMTHPKISIEEKRESLQNIFEGRISKEMLGFLRLLLEKERFQELEGVLEFFLEEVKEIKGIGVAYVTTAQKLDEASEKKIENKLLATTKYNKMEMHYVVDESIIGGVIIRMKDRVVDGSVQTKISECKKQLMKIQV